VPETNSVDWLEVFTGIEATALTYNVVKK